MSKLSQCILSKKDYQLFDYEKSDLALHTHLAVGALPLVVAHILDQIQVQSWSTKTILAFIYLITVALQTKNLRIS
jgi:hypothetical protein